MSRIHPGLPGAVVRASKDLYATENGLRRGIDITVSPEIFEQYKQGYRCLKCHAAQEAAFPDECLEPYCRFPIKKDQARLMEVEFQGEEDLWPTRKDDSGIWTPG